MRWTDWAREHTDPGKAGTKREALAGVTVFDLSYGSFAGLFASSLLAEFGARVIRIEPPQGDIARRMTPFGLTVQDTGLAYLVEGRNKEHITLDITRERGRGLLRDLVRKGDVLIETFPPGYLEDLGLGWEVLREVNPRLIHLSLNTYGQKGELAEKARQAGWRCYDVIAQALSGFVFTTGLPEEYEEFPAHARVPTRMGNWMAWYAGGAMGAFAVMAALLFREGHGRGQRIDLSPAEALMCMNNYALHFYHLTQDIVSRTGNFEPAAHPYCYVRCKDGLNFLAGYADPNWKAVCDIIGRPDLVEKYPTLADRNNPQNTIPIAREIEKFTMQYTREEVVKIWAAYKGPGVTVTGEVMTPEETARLDHWYERAVLIKARDKHYGEVLLPGVPVKMSETPPRVKWICRPVGADNAFVYLDLLGLDGKALAVLKEEGVL
ncbi:MAG: CaiB/BaiF CoA transferase family protein [Desulfotomaculales bacterium]